MALQVINNQKSILEYLAILRSQFVGAFEYRAYLVEGNKRRNEMIQLLVISSIILIIIEMLLIVTCIKWLYSIRLACTNIWLMSQDFSNSFITAKEEVILLHKELKELTTLTTKKEHHILHMTVHLNEVEMCIKMLLDEFRGIVQFSNPKEKAKLQKILEKIALYK